MFSGEGCGDKRRREIMTVLAALPKLIVKKTPLFSVFFLVETLAMYDARRLKKYRRARETDLIRTY